MSYVTFRGDALKTKDKEVKEEDIKLFMDLVNYKFDTSSFLFEQATQEGMEKIVRIFSGAVSDTEQLLSTSFAKSCKYVSITDFGVIPCLAFNKDSGEIFVWFSLKGKEKKEEIKFNEKYCTSCMDFESLCKAIDVGSVLIFDK